jgi:hypothetical protein
MKIELDNKKYAWIFDADTGSLECLRNGEKWRNETGDKAILALMEENKRLQKEKKELKYHISSVYWQTTCDMTRDYLSQIKDIDYDKFLKNNDVLYDFGQPCDHVGCLSHISHPCEKCGRISGKGVVFKDKV